MARFRPVVYALMLGVLAALPLAPRAQGQVGLPYPPAPADTPVGMPFISFVPRPIDPLGPLTLDVEDGYVIVKQADDNGTFGQNDTTNVGPGNNVLNADGSPLTEDGDPVLGEDEVPLAGFGALFNNQQFLGESGEVAAIRGFCLEFVSTESVIFVDSFERSSDLQTVSGTPTFTFFSESTFQPETNDYLWRVCFSQPEDGSYLFGREPFGEGFLVSDHFLAATILAGNFTDPVTNFTFTASPNRFAPTAVPEPGAMALGAVLCAGGVALLRRRR